MVGGEEILEITPVTKQVNQLNADDLNTLVNLNNMQFIASQIGLTYAGEPADSRSDGALVARPKLLRRTGAWHL